MPDSNEQLLPVDWAQVREHFTQLRNDHTPMLAEPPQDEPPQDEPPQIEPPQIEPPQIEPPTTWDGVRHATQELSRAPISWGAIRAGTARDAERYNAWRLNQDQIIRQVQMGELAELPEQLPVFAPTPIDGRIIPVPHQDHVKERPMHQQQTEQTMITVLQQGVADAILLLRTIKANADLYNAPLTLLNFPFGITDPKSSPLDMVTVRIDHAQHSIPMHDTFSPACRGDYYGTNKLIHAPAVVVAHPAFITALEECIEPSPATERLRAIQIEGIEEFFAARPTQFSLHTIEHRSDSHAIPQLGVYMDHIRAGISGGYQFAPHTPLWKAREHTRLYLGEYTPLPDKVLELLPSDIIDQQIPHLAVKGSNAGMIAYTQSPVAGMMDRQQVIKPGRYLKQHCPNLSDQQIKELAADCFGMLAAGFHHSREADDYANVYINGPSSCMAYSDDSKYWARLQVNGEFFHPCRVYAHPENDLEIVWLEVSGRIVARAIVNKAKMRYPRIYSCDSASNSARRMEDYLENLGYYQCNDALVGQKLLRVSPDEYPDAIICPYIDYYNVGVKIHDNQLYTARGYNEANHETGCLHGYDTDCDPDWHCECCGEGMSEDDEQNETTNYDTVCNHCIDNHYTRAYCVSREHRIYTDDTVYTDHSPRNNMGVLYLEDSWGDYVALDDGFYDSDAAAHMDYVTSTVDDTYILTLDTGRYGYVIEDGTAYPVNEWVSLDGDMVHESDIDGDDHKLVDTTSANLRVYITRENPEAGEAA